MQIAGDKESIAGPYVCAHVEEASAANGQLVCIYLPCRMNSCMLARTIDVSLDGHLGATHAEQYTSISCAQPFSIYSFSCLILRKGIRVVSE